MQDTKPRGFERSIRLNGERNARVVELGEDFQPKFDLKDIKRLRRLAGRLSTARDISHLFDRYTRLDQRMEVIELRLDDSATGWDRFVEMESERARGK